MDSGIYKWTSPTKRIYVGQSKNLIKRKEWYLSKGIETACMPKLKRSFKKYSIDNHIFEIIEYCSEDQLNNREIYWGLFYDTLENGLNCKLGEQNCIFSESTKNKMSKAKKGIKQTEEQKRKRKLSTKETWKKKMENGYKRAYYKQTEEAKQKISKFQKGKIVNEKTRKKISDSLIGKTKSKKHKENISKSKKGKLVHTDESKQKLKDHGKFRDLTKMWEASIKSTSKGIIQYDVNGNFIKEWPSANKAEYFYTGEKKDNIRQTIRHFEKTGIQWKAYGFVWKSK